MEIKMLFSSITEYTNPESDFFINHKPC